jgi:hypothetical protein
MTRFHDRGRYGSEFEQEFAVRCSQCGQRAIALGDGYGLRAKSARLVCGNCGHNAVWTCGHYRGRSVGTARRGCRRCGRLLKQRFHSASHKHDAVLKCDGCGYEMKERIYWSPRRSAAPCDPWFRLPLWFVAESKGHPFWAYNAAHLAFLKNYIGATLRIREPHRNGSLASRLPSFLLDRKNRPAVLRAIAALEKR